MLPKQLQHYHIDISQLPACFRRWENVKTVYNGLYAAPNIPVHMRRPPAGGMKQLLRVLGIAHVGRAHSGIDDTRNIVSIVQRLRHDGAPEFRFGADASIPATSTTMLGQALAKRHQIPAMCRYD
jgi:hypothetical protein